MSRFIEEGEGIVYSIIENDMEEQSTEDEQESQDETTTMPTPHYTTVTGRVSCPPACLVEEMGEAALTAAEQNYYYALSKYQDEQEDGCGGIGIGSGITNTHELKVMRYDEAMAGLDKKEWEVSVQCKHDRMVKNEVWDVADKDNIPKGTDVIDSTWAINKKANGDYRA